MIIYEDYTGKIIDAIDDKIRVMNYVAHGAVAKLVNLGVSDEFVYGSMLPDFAGMARTKLIRPILNQEIENGVKFHYATDYAFDRNDKFRLIKARFFEIHNKYLPRGAARACADPGSEILLDGFALDIPGAADLFDRVMVKAARYSIKTDSLTIDQVALNELNQKMAEYGAPIAYRDVEFAAISLHRRLSDRPRLSFSEDLIDRVAETFELQQKVIGRVAAILFRETVSDLSGFRP